MTLKLVRVDYKYCDFLRQYDSRVVYNSVSKENRPYIGVLFKIDECEYFAPVSSPKEKHLKMHTARDFIKIDNGKLGAINFNNMIPITEKNYTLVNVLKNTDNIELKQYNILLQKQLDWLNANYVQVQNKSKKLYELSITG